MSGYDLFIAARSRSEIEATAYAWRSHFDVVDTYVPDLPHILELDLPKILPNFTVRVWDVAEMPGEEARTWHSVPAIDIRDDIYGRLCNGDPRARFTAAHELGHLFLHSGESRPRAVAAIKSVAIPANKSSEAQANAFAASFLMPVHVVRQFESPADLASGCRVSMSAAERRMRELTLWPKRRPPIPEVQEFLRQMKAQMKKDG